MTAGTLRKLTPTEAYSVSTTLEGVRPGRRHVKELVARRLDDASVDGLAPLAGFPDLRSLSLERIRAVDLGPLASLPLTGLGFEDARDLDFAPLAGLRELRHLGLVSVVDCRVSAQLALSPALETLVIDNTERPRDGSTVKALVDAIDWSALTRLESLSLSIGHPSWVEPVGVDLSFLGRLTRLVHLYIQSGIWHSGPGASPLDPPFDGLPRTLTLVRIDAWEPTETRAALAQYLPDAEILVSRREQVRIVEPQPDWAVLRVDGDPEQWGVYGSLFEALDGLDGERELETEHEAVAVARKRIRAADPALLRRLDFDHESDGTGITAPTVEDLEHALTILAVRDTRSPETP